MAKNIGRTHIDLGKIKSYPGLRIILNILYNFACFIVSVEFINSSLILLGEPEAPSKLSSMVP